MKKILFTLLILFCTQIAYAEDGYDFDMKFIDNPFAGQKMVSDKEFNSVVEKMSKKKEPSWFSKLIFGGSKKKEEIDPNLQKQFETMPSELGSVKDAISAKPVLTLGARVVDYDGNILPSGHYQVDLKNMNGQNYIVFLQAHQTVGRFRATPCSDSWQSNQIIYSRVIEAGQGAFKIIYSNLDGTHQGFANIAE